MCPHPTLLSASPMWLHGVVLVFVRTMPLWPVSSVQGFGKCPCFLPRGRLPAVAGPAPRPSAWLRLSSPHSLGRSCTLPCLAVCRDPLQGCLLPSSPPWSWQQGLRHPAWPANPPHPLPWFSLSSHSPRHTMACSFLGRVSRFTSVSWSSLPSEPPPSALQTPQQGSPCGSSRLSAPLGAASLGAPCQRCWPADGYVRQFHAAVRALAGGTALPLLVVFLRACSIDRSHPFSGYLSSSALWPIFGGAQISLSVKC